MLHAANGTRIKVYDKKYVTMDIRLRRRFNCPFSVADVGMDFLATNGLLVDLKHRRLIDGLTNLSSTGGVTDTSVHSVTLVDSNHPFRELMTEFKHITLPTMIKTAVQHDVSHHIQTKGPPVASKCRRMAPDKVSAAKKEFQVMIDLGICRPSNSSSASPLHFVPKKAETGDLWGTTEH